MTTFNICWTITFTIATMCAPPFGLVVLIVGGIIALVRIQKEDNACTQKWAGR